MKITADSRNPVFSFAPQSTEQEVMQNLSLLICAVKYSLPLAREMGLGSEYLHRPQNAAQALIVRDIHENAEAYEPRANILNVEFAADSATGETYVKIEAEVK
ncbi:MAG: hypothetical protein NC452_17265 [Eubacterium sp.]|nr:hypothetical protein [Eubacterium sp.]